MQIKEKSARENLQTLLPFKSFTAISALKPFSELCQNLYKFTLAKTHSLEHCRVKIHALKIIETLSSYILMPSLKVPSPVTIRRIYYALVRKPCSSKDLVKRTGVEEAALGLTIDFLKKKGMIVSYNFAGHQMLKMVRTKPLKYSWNFPWLDLMMSEDDWKTPWKQAVYGKTEADDKVDKRFVNLLKDLLVDSNLDLVEVLEELDMTDVPLEALKLHNQEPYCLECLKKEKRFVKMILCEQSEEHCCPNCGVVRETLLIKRH